MQKSPEHDVGQETPETKQSTVKERAIEFYKDKNVPGALEKLLNVMFLDAPDDAYGYMSEYFHKLSKEPVISRFEGCELLDNSGVSSLELTVHCIINGIEKLICTYSHPLLLPKAEVYSTAPTPTPATTPNPPSTEGENVDTVNEETEEAYVSPLELLPQINDILKGVNVKSQVEINNCVSENHSLFDTDTQTSVTRATAILLSKVSEVPLFLSLAKTFKDNDSESLCLPSPLCEIVTRGAGKLKVRGIYISPSHTTSLNDGINHLVSIYKEVGRVLSAKQGPAALNANGAYTITFDKLETIMDLVRDSISASGLQPKEDILMFIDVGADSFYNKDKKKYEFATGQMKTGEELVMLYSNLLSNYPGLTGFIDPLHPKDITNWQSIMEKLCTDCLIIANKVLPDLPLIKPVTSIENDTELNCSTTLPHVSSVVVSYIDNPLIKCFKDAQHFRDLSDHLIYSIHQCWTTDSLAFDTDLAVALQAKLIKIGPPVGVTSSIVLSRLLQIQRQLESLNIQGYFPSLISSSKSEC